MTYILSRPSSTWTGLLGRINQDKIQTFLKNYTLKQSSSSSSQSSSVSPVIGGIEGNEDYLYAICGPDQFTQSINRLVVYEKKFYSLLLYRKINASQRYKGYRIKVSNVFQKMLNVKDWYDDP